MKNLFDDFLIAFQKSIKSNKSSMEDVLANVFSMRIIGNKTHGDLAEIALTEYINQFVDGFSAKHTGKEKFRAKEHEEDVRVRNEKTGGESPISIKTYGTGPLQLSTNKDSSMFSYLTETIGKGSASDKNQIAKILNYTCFNGFAKMNVLPLIYNEKHFRYKIILFDFYRAIESVREIKFLPPREFGKGRSTFPIYKFYGPKGAYIFEVRYGDAKANALQRGLWTHTENAKEYFNELLVGDYKINEPLINLMSKILVSPKKKHEELLKYFPKSKKKSIL